MPLVKDWFFLKPQFTSFKISPHKHPQYLFGAEDNHLKDNLLTSLHEATYSEMGYRAVVFGQAGRGKTHLANHLLYHAGANGLPLEIVYVDCPTIPSPKSPVHTFFAPMIRSIPTDTIRRVGPKFFLNKTSEWEARVQDELKNPVIYATLLDGLTAVNPVVISDFLGWLGGELWAGVTNLNGNAPKQITSETQIARNVGALGLVFLLAEQHNLIFLVDEAERLQSITGGEHYFKWLAGLRELFRRDSVGVLLFIIARNRDDIPLVLLEDEIISVIGVNNIYPCPPYAQQQADSFLRELLQHLVITTPIPAALNDILTSHGESITTYPFTQNAFDSFVTYHSVGENVNIPREIINSLQSAAQRAISEQKHLIDNVVLQQVIQGNI